MASVEIGTAKTTCLKGDPAVSIGASAMALFFRDDQIDAVTIAIVLGERSSSLRVLPRDAQGAREDALFADDDAEWPAATGSFAFEPSPPPASGPLFYRQRRWDLSFTAPSSIRNRTAQARAWFTTAVIGWRTWLRRPEGRRRRGPRPAP